ncbi:hypothetical protein [Candidatus Methylacidiphilum fumarolicum]|uniref:Uncharacterized protein n=1 Tax=Candidatus Methylacidiphilum fumarolicum TaxID=591154 RepID=A0ABN8XGL0_9BACT|nr:hypothetical protein [Candidatus Methylacidiphilum fumarolicum]CAI9085790.1 protein of unknown function [Candidatus Methylacidiphilum fumarolicum]
MNGQIPLFAGKDDQGAPFDPSLLSQALFTGCAKEKTRGHGESR